MDGLRITLYVAVIEIDPAAILYQHMLYDTLSRHVENWLFYKRHTIIHIDFTLGNIVKLAF